MGFFCCCCFNLKSVVSAPMLDLGRRMYLQKRHAPFKFLSKGILQETLELLREVTVIYQICKDTSLWLSSPLAATNCSLPFSLLLTVEVNIDLSLLHDFTL